MRPFFFVLLRGKCLSPRSSGEVVGSRQQDSGILSMIGRAKFHEHVHAWAREIKHVLVARRRFVSVGDWCCYGSGLTGNG